MNCQGSREDTRGIKETEKRASGKGTYGLTRDRS